mgnify:FL=1
MNKLEKLYEVIKAQRPNLSKREFSEDYLEMSSGYMTAMSYYGRDISLKALANLTKTSRSEVDAWQAIHASSTTQRNKQNLERVQQLHAMATDTLLEAI